MLRHYLVTALRSLARHKLYSFINIAGLAVGLACAIFIILFIRDEISYDKWIPGSESLYRVESTISEPGRSPNRGTKIPFPVPQAMLQGIPEVRAMTHLIPQSMTIITGSHQFLEQVDIVDPGFFQVIRLPLVQGSPARVFAQPESIVLSQKAARKYFGNAPAVGKAVTITGEVCDAGRQNCQTRKWPLVVTGILRDLPHNTQLRADFLVPNTSAADPMTQGTKDNGWLWFDGWAYIRLAPGADPAAVVAKLKTILDRSFDPKKMINLNIRASELLIPSLAPFRDDHLSTDQYGGMTPAGSWTTVYGFAAIGVLILLVACFNFTNLATARAMLRAREIGLRKCVGAARRQLIVQFLGESVLIALLALILALAMVEVLLPAFDSFLGRPIAIHYLADWPLAVAILAIAVMAGLLSGIYPALVMSGFRPAAILRGPASGSGSGFLRTALVVLQFAVSIGLGVAVAVVFAQISFARNIDTGFQKSGVVIINAADMAPATRESFAEALRHNPRISDVALSDAVPLGGNVRADTLRAPGGVSSQSFRFISMSPNFTDLYHVRLLAGRPLSKSRGADRHREKVPFNALMSATGARRLGFTPQTVIGKTFLLPDTSMTVVGVLDDIQMEGPRKPFDGVFYFYDPKHTPFVSVRVRQENLPATLSFIDQTWRAFAPTIALQRHFLTDDFDAQFKADERQGTIFALFVGIAIFIACLGLFGLAAFSTERRTREIGLRKTFGASTGDIVRLLLWQFSVPVLIANAIAWPVAWYWLHDWLEGFAYRITLSPLYFIGAGAVALAIAWATVLVHARRVANANPVHALRTE